jgi:hypothetical protein
MPIKPFFLTGANAKVKVNGKVVAFCTDLSYSIQVLHQTPKVLGMYEGTSVEPIGYSVSGSFRVVRYIRNATEAIKDKPRSVKKVGNGIGNLGEKDIIKGFLNDGRTDESLIPADLENAAGFDIEVHQKLPGTDKTIGVAKIRNCRITQADFSLSKRSTAIQTFNFVALYADEDSFEADFSGRGQQF